MVDFLKNIFNKFINIFSKKSTKNLMPIENFHLSKFLGRWYEIARYDHSFEKYQMNVYCDYILNKDNKSLIIKNYGKYKNEFHLIEGVGKFKIKNYESIGWLKISFLRPFYFDYKILYIDDDYKYAIITSSSYDYFWILSRYEEIDEKTLNTLIKISEEFGFKKSKMIFN